MADNPHAVPEQSSSPVSAVSDEFSTHGRPVYTRITRKPVPTQVVNPVATALLDSSDEVHSHSSSTMQLASKSEISHDTPSIRQPWPPVAKSLQRRGWGRVSPVLVDILMILGPLLFFALAIALAVIHGRQVDNTDASALRNGTTVAGTMFPIIFAAIVGRATARAAAWQLERGSTLGRLEQLLGSRTIFGTITTQWLLGSFNLVGLFLVFLWILSPFGGQAALRILSTKTRSDLTTVDLQYFDSSVESQFAERQVSSPKSSISVDQWFLQLNALYIASILAPQDIYLGSMDLWGNVKIPIMSSLTSTPSSNWVSVPYPSQDAAYSSLVGIPIRDSNLSNRSLAIESTYVDLDCDQPANGPIIPINTTAFVGQEILSFTSSEEDEQTYSALRNGSFQGFSALNSSSLTLDSTFVQATWSLALDTFVNHMYNSTSVSYGVPYAYPGYFINDTGIEAQQARLLFQSNIVIGNNHYNPTMATHSYCSVKQVYVESRVSCTSSPGTVSTRTTNCTVLEQRLSQKPHVRPEISPLSFPDVFQWVSYGLPRAFGITGLEGSSDPAMFFLEKPVASFIATASGPANLTNLPSTSDFSARLTQLINTYLTLSQAGFQITGFTDETTIAANLTTVATISSNHEIYHVSWPWLAVFVVATLAMFAAAMFGIICGCVTRTPEVLGFASSNIRDSRYITIPPGGGTIGGMEMSRKLKDLRLRLGSVNEDDRGAESIRLGVGRAFDVTKVSKDLRYL